MLNLFPPSIQEESYRKPLETEALSVPLKTKTLRVTGQKPASVTLKRTNRIPNCQVSIDEYVQPFHRSLNVRLY